jgi:hypothetical protein
MAKRGLCVKLGVDTSSCGCTKWARQRGSFFRKNRAIDLSNWPKIVRILRFVAHQFFINRNLKINTIEASSRSVEAANMNRRRLTNRYATKISGLKLLMKMKTTNLSPQCLIKFQGNRLHLQINNELT